MNIFKSILTVFESTMPTPSLWGLVHILSIALVMLFTLFLCFRFKDANYSTFKRIILIFWLGMVILEIYKQIEYTFSIENNMIVADYQWYAFPYQFCSAIIYVAPFAIFTKPHTRVHEFSLAFISTFSLLAGILVMCYPADVFVSTIGINIQTMYHHGSQVILGVYVLMYNRHKVNVKFFLKACITFSIVVTIALALNLIAPYFTSETFNMFYISPYYECTLPVLSSIYAILHPMGLYLVFLAIYICAFSLGAFILSGMFYVAYLIYSRIRYSGKVKPVNVVYKKIEIMA